MVYFLETYNFVSFRFCAKENYDSMVSHMVGDLHHLQTEGFEYWGEQWFLVTIGVKGDVPFFRDIGKGPCAQRTASRLASAGYVWLDFHREVHLRTSI